MELVVIINNIYVCFHLWDSWICNESNEMENMLGSNPADQFLFAIIILSKNNHHAPFLRTWFRRGVNRWHNKWRNRTVRKAMLKQENDPPYLVRSAHSILSLHLVKKVKFYWLNSLQEIIQRWKEQFFTKNHHWFALVGRRRLGISPRSLNNRRLYSSRVVCTVFWISST